MANPTKFTWVIPTANTDPTIPFTAAEITGFSLGVRPASGTAGTYTIVTPIASATATSEPLAALSQVLLPGSYVAAIQSVGPTNSAWSTEVSLSIAAPVPNPPSGFSVA